GSKSGMSIGSGGTYIWNRHFHKFNADDQIITHPISFNVEISLPDAVQVISRRITLKGSSFDLRVYNL
ncbi:hypothetical protein L9F63_019364, partial [Diploptera punctata]